VKLGEKFLKEVGTDLSKIKSANIENLAPTEYDLVISNYAFSELPRDVQINYVKSVLAPSKRGYLTMNSGRSDWTGRSAGKLTLDENIADLGGVGIALEALKHEMREKKIPQEKWPQAFRHFFIGYAVSWRTKYRDEKLRYGLQVDKHAPAFLRVNLVVNQFQEWYDAFEIPQAAQLYQTPEDRIRIF
jgi:hypothetical protein